MGPAEIQEHCRLDEAGDRLLKLARTIADLNSAHHIETSDLAEALQYRPREWG